MSEAEGARRSAIRALRNQLEAAMAADPRPGDEKLNPILAELDEAGVLVDEAFDVTHTEAYIKLLKDSIFQGALGIIGLLVKSGSLTAREEKSLIVALTMARLARM